MPQRMSNELALSVRVDLVAVAVLALDQIVAVRLRINLRDLSASESLGREHGRQFLAQIRIGSCERRGSRVCECENHHDRSRQIFAHIASAASNQRLKIVKSHWPRYPRTGGRRTPGMTRAKVSGHPNSGAS